MDVARKSVKRVIASAFQLPVPSVALRFLSPQFLSSPFLSPFALKYPTKKSKHPRIPIKYVVRYRDDFIGAVQVEFDTEQNSCDHHGNHHCACHADDHVFPGNTRLHPASRLTTLFRLKFFYHQINNHFHSVMTTTTRNNNNNKSILGDIRLGPGTQFTTIVYDDKVH